MKKKHTESNNICINAITNVIKLFTETVDQVLSIKQKTIIFYKFDQYTHDTRHKVIINQSINQLIFD